MISNNEIPIRIRIKELFFEWVTIAIYLIVLLIVCGSLYILLLGTISPNFNEITVQMISIFTSYLPIVLWFAFKDLKGGTYGKKKAGLTVYFRNKSLIYSIIRNLVKFLPWQLGHIYTIHSIYHGYDRFAQLTYGASVILFLIMLSMGLLRKDKRHLGDFAAGTQVQFVINTEDDMVK